MVKASEASKEIHGLFEQIAGRYDLINDLQSFFLHRVWKRELLKEAGVKGGDLLLDACTGTGDLVKNARRSGVRCIGVDFSERMLQEGRTQGKDHPNQLLLCGNALHLPFPDDTFDAVSVGYGLRNIPELNAALLEMKRVLKPNGRLVVLEFGKPENRVWRWVYFCYLRFAVPLFGKFFLGNASAYAYILASLQKYPGQKGLDDLLRKLGFESTHIREFLGGVMSLNSAEKGQGGG